MLLFLLSWQWPRIEPTILLACCLESTYNAFPKNGIRRELCWSCFCGIFEPPNFIQFFDGDQSCKLFHNGRRADFKRTPTSA
jgi:hypothetical protein